MKALFRLFVILVVGSAFVAGAQPESHTKARLTVAVESAQPGETVLAGVSLRMDPGWHTYWVNSGASGDPTEIKWELPPGITAGEIQWPVPYKFPPEDLATYGYKDEVVLIVPLKLAANLQPGPREIKAHVSWLECEDVCLPGSADVTATFQVGSETKPGPDAALIAEWQKKLPKDGKSLGATAQWGRTADGGLRPLTIEFTSAGAVTEADFFVYPNPAIEPRGGVETLPVEKGKLSIRKQVKKYEGDWPKEISGLIVQTVGGERTGYEVTIPVGVAAAAEIVYAPFSWLKLLIAVASAFLGGLILNVMPCVLPVIALKIFSFIKQGGEEPGRARRLSLIYAVGVLCSFLALAIFMIGVQKAGEIASWGMQMQNPNFVIAMTILVTFVALNLFGLFEITLQGGAMNKAGALASKSGAPGAFFNGVLATALAIPCTAPFLAGALAFAFSQPPSIILLTFTFVALGLAAPYVVLTWNPRLLKFIPKPGPWMNRFKILLGFPMLATVIWLYKLASNHLTKSQALWFGILLVTIGLAAWMWGEFVQRGTRRRGLSAAISLALVTGVAIFAFTRKEGIQWQPWSIAAVEQARAGGRPVLVDFTADWCPTCKVNLHTSIDVPSVREKLSNTRAVTLLGDYTKKDAAIAAELERYGRNAVPLVLVFPADPSAEPIVLPPVLTPGIVLDALGRAAGERPDGRTVQASTGSTDGTQIRE